MRKHWGRSKRGDVLSLEPDLAGCLYYSATASLVTSFSCCLPSGVAWLSPLMDGLSQLCRLLDLTCAHEMLFDEGPSPADH